MVADRIRASPCFSRKASPIAASDLVTRRFASHPTDTPTSRYVRGVLLVIAQDWDRILPDGEEKQQALDHLDRAGELACAAYDRRLVTQPPA